MFERHRSTLTEHTNIVKALKSKNSSEVRAAVYTHVDSSMKVLLLRMEQYQ